MTSVLRIAVSLGSILTGVVGVDVFAPFCAMLMLPSSYRGHPSWQYEQLDRAKAVGRYFVPGPLIVLKKEELWN